MGKINSMEIYMFAVNFVLFQGAVIFYLHILRNDRVKAV